MVRIQLAPTHSKSLLEAMDKVKNPREKCEQLHQQIKALLEELKKIANSDTQCRIDSLLPYTLTCMNVAISVFHMLQLFLIMVKVCNL